MEATTGENLSESRNGGQHAHVPKAASMTLSTKHHQAAISDQTFRYAEYKRTYVKRPERRGKVERCCMCCVLCYREQGFCTIRNAGHLAALFLLLFGLMRLLIPLIALKKPKNGFSMFIEPILFFVESTEKAERFSFIVAPAVAFLYDIIPAALILFAVRKYSESCSILFSSLMIVGTSVSFLQGFFSVLFLLAQNSVCKDDGEERLGCRGEELSEIQLINAAVFSFIFFAIRLHFLKCSVGFAHELRAGKFEKVLVAHSAPPPPSSDGTNKGPGSQPTPPPPPIYSLPSQTNNKISMDSSAKVQMADDGTSSVMMRTSTENPMHAQMPPADGETEEHKKVGRGHKETKKSHRSKNGKKKGSKKESKLSDNIVGRLPVLFPASAKTEESSPQSSSNKKESAGPSGQDKAEEGNAAETDPTEGGRLDNLAKNFAGIRSKVGDKVPEKFRKKNKVSNE